MLLFYFWPKMNIWRKLGKSRPQKLTNPKVLYHSKNYSRQWLWTRWAEVDRWGKPTFIFDPSHSWVMNLWSERFGNPRTASTPGAENRHTLLQPLTLLEAAVPAPARLITGPCLSTGHSLLPTLFYDLCGLSARGLGCHYAVQCLGLLACDLVQRRRL